VKKKHSTKQKKVPKHTTPKTGPGSWSGLIAQNKRLARLRAAARRRAPKRPARRPFGQPTAKTKRLARRIHAAISKPEPCQHYRTRVLETRRPTFTHPNRDPGVHTLNTRIRRRLKCLNCNARFTTYTAAKSTGPDDRWKDRLSNRTRP
jgi:hypothetical protein